jgi:hypothetical protein
MIHLIVNKINPFIIFIQIIASYKNPHHKIECLHLIKLNRLKIRSIDQFLHVYCRYLSKIVYNNQYLMSSITFQILCSYPSYWFFSNRRACHILCKCVLPHTAQR